MSEPIEEARCSEHHPDSWWPGDKRCDKAEGHRGKHVFQRRTLYGADPSEFTFWDATGSATFIDRKARKAFLATIDAREAALDEQPAPTITPRSEREALPWGERVALNAREITALLQHERTRSATTP